MSPKTRKSALEQVRAMLEEREDITLVAGPPNGIQGCQLRRMWTETTRGTEGAGFNPVTTQHWAYYGQLFLITVLRSDKEGELLPELRRLATQFGRGGALLILIDPENPLDAVIDSLGPVPEKFKEYLARAQK